MLVTFARSIALGLMCSLMIGVLKGSSLMSMIATGSLCVALVVAFYYLGEDG